MKHWLGNDRGLTLVEMLVAVAIMASMAGIVFAYQMTTVRAYNRQEQDVELQQTVRIVLDRLVQTVRNAREITVVEMGGSVPCPLGHKNCAVYARSNSLVVTSMDGDGQVNVRVFYVESSGTLMQATHNSLHQSPGVNPLADHIVSMDARWVDSSKRLLSLTIIGSSTSGEAGDRYELETRVKPRFTQQ